MRADKSATRDGVGVVAAGNSPGPVLLGVPLIEPHDGPIPARDAHAGGDDLVDESLAYVLRHGLGVLRGERSERRSLAGGKADGAGTDHGGGDNSLEHFHASLLALSPSSL